MSKPCVLPTLIYMDAIYLAWSPNAQNEHYVLALGLGMQRKAYVRSRMKYFQSGGDRLQKTRENDQRGK